MKKLLVILGVVLCVMIIGGVSIAKDVTTQKDSTGQVVYIGMAKNFFVFDSTQLINSRLFLRNKDRFNPVRITSIEIYNPSGDYVLDLVTTPIILDPLASDSRTLPSGVPRLPNTGGRYSALVTWESDVPVTPVGVGTAVIIMQFGVVNTHNSIGGYVIE